MPDEVVRRAEQVELVDITPEALRRRMAHGNVYAAGEGRRGAGQLLPAAQPHRPAGDGAALAGRPGRGRPAALPRRPAHHRDLGDPRTGRRRADRRRRRARPCCAAPPASPSGPARPSCSPCTCCAATGSPAPRSGALRRAAPPRRGRRRVVPHRRRRRTCPPRCWTSPAGSTPPSSSSAPPAGPGWPACSSRASAPRVVQDSGHIDVHMVTHPEAGRGIRLPRRFSARPGHPPGRGLGAGAAAAARRHCGRRARPRTCSGCPPTSCCSSSPPWSSRWSAGSGRRCSPPWPAGCCSTSSSPRRSTPSPSPSGRT